MKKKNPADEEAARRHVHLEHGWHLGESANYIKAHNEMHASSNASPPYGYGVANHSHVERN